MYPHQLYIILSAGKRTVGGTLRGLQQCVSVIEQWMAAIPLSQSRQDWIDVDGH